MIKLPNQSAWLISVFYSVLLDWGVKDDALRDQFGLDLEQLGTMTSHVTIDQFRHLGEVAQTLTQRPDIGLILGKDAEYDESKGGIILSIAVNSPTIRHLLLELEKLSFLFKDILTFRVETENDTCEIRIDYFKAGDMGLPLVEFYTSGFISVLKYLIGDEFRLMRLAFPYPAPDHINSYHQAFDTQLIFDQDMTSILFHKKHLDVSIPRPAVPIVKEMLSKIVDTHLEGLNQNSSFQETIRELIMTHLPGGEVGIETIARKLNINRGVIYRRLKKENTSYKELLTTTRKQLAKRHLMNPSLTIDMISSMLGYTESSAFKRAFKSWFGVNPGQYRKKTT